MTGDLEMWKAIIALSLATIALSGCVTVSESDYKLGRNYLAENPGLKRELITECIAERRAESLAERNTNAAFMNVSVKAYPDAFCRRVINAYANGRLSYSDVQKAIGGYGDSSKMIRILQGR